MGCDLYTCADTTLCQRVKVADYMKTARARHEGSPEKVTVVEPVYIDPNRETGGVAIMRMTEAVWGCVLLFSLVGCADSEKSKGGDECDSSIASADRIVGTIDGEDWDGAPVVWMWAGDSIQALSEEEDGWRMTFFLQATEDGLAMRDLEEDGGLPVSIDLGSDDGGVTLYTDDGDSYTTGADAPGSLTITQMDDVTLEACFSFTAESSLGGTVEVSEGAFYAGLFE